MLLGRGFLTAIVGCQGVENRGELLSVEFDVDDGT
jgi:hypothetical protein